MSLSVGANTTPAPATSASESRGQVEPRGIGFGVDLSLAATLLCCPRDHSALRPVDAALECASCTEVYPLVDGVLSLLSPTALGAQERREQACRDEESSWYDSMYEGYTNIVEVPTCLARLGRPSGPILDHGSGTGRITSTLVHLGQPVVAVDYSGASLRRLVGRCPGAPAGRAGRTPPPAGAGRGDLGGHVDPGVRALRA